MLTQPFSQYGSQVESPENAQPMFPENSPPINNETDVVVVSPAVVQPPVRAFVIELDDYPLILGSDFLVKAKAIPIPHMAVMILLREEGAVTVSLQRSRQVPLAKSLAAVQGEKQGECKDSVKASTSNPQKKTFADVVKCDIRA